MSATVSTPGLDKPEFDPPGHGDRGLDKESLDLALDSLREFAREKLPAETILDLDHRDEFPLALVREMCGEALGIQLLFIDEEYGGLGGGAFDVYRVCEELARIDLGVATGVLATFLGSDPIAFGGSEEQRRNWLGRIAEEGLLMAYCATEPEAGSDLAALRTTATPIRAEGPGQDAGVVTGYRINGSKQWISNGGFADLYSVLALAPGGPSWFIVEKGARGLEPGRPEDKHGIRASNTSAVNFTDVEVPAGHLVGDVEGQGLVQAQAVFGYTRLMVAAFGLGAGWEALSRAIPYSRERIQAGGPLSEKPGYTHKLILPHVVRLEASRAVIEETAERIDAGEGALNTEGAIAKYLASEAGNRAAEDAIQALGGYGYTREYMVEKIKRDVRITTIYEGTSEILEMTIARDRWQEHLKTRGRHYHDAADALEASVVTREDLGVSVAALALRALAEVLEQCRLGRLTRNQHVLLRLGELIAHTEAAASLVRRAHRALQGRLPEKAAGPLDGPGLTLATRIYARETALLVAEQGLRWVCGGGDLSDSDLRSFESSLGVAAIHGAQRGLLADMGRLAELLYERI